VRVFAEGRDATLVGNGGGGGLFALAGVVDESVGLVDALSSE